MGIRQDAGGSRVSRVARLANPTSGTARMGLCFAPQIDVCSKEHLNGIRGKLHENGGDTRTAGYP